MNFKAFAVPAGLLAMLCGIGLSLGGCPTVDDPNTNGSANENANTSANSNSSSSVGDATAGQQKFADTCSNCHTGRSVKSYRSLITNNMGSLSNAMNGITLTDQEVADLKAYLAGL